MHRTVWAGGGSASGVPAESAMRERALRSVLLIKAVEEADLAGTLLPAADRAAATRDAARGQDEATAATALGSRGALAQEGATAAREARGAAARPAGGSRPRRGLGHSPWPAGPGGWGRSWSWLSLAAGFSLSALDGTRRINVLAFPLLGLVLWNLLVYLLVVARWIRALGRRAPSPSPVARLLAQAGLAGVRRMIARSAAFNTPLAGALGRFIGEWYEAARPCWWRAPPVSCTSARPRSESA